MAWRVALAAVAALGLMTGVAEAKPKPPGKDAKVWAAVEAATPGSMALLKDLTAIDSQTGDKEGAAKIHAILIPRLKALGADVQVSPSENPDVADNVIATLTGKGKVRILIIAHIDTVYPRGTAAKWPWREADGKASAPGVTDEKGGVVQALTALEILKGFGHDDYAKITFLIDGSEETGSPGSTQLIRKLAREHDVELNMEPGDAPDAITVWRKGSANIRIDVHGRPAHSGVAPQNGRNAAVELIHQLETANQFPKTGDGVTVNLTVLRAGERTNIIPDLASGTLNVRVREFDDFEKITNAFRESAKTTVVPDTRVEVTRTGNFPPLKTTPGTQALADRASGIYAELGRPLAHGGNGGDFHTDKEWMDLSSVQPRLYLTVRLIIDLGKNPPLRAP